ncbi:MAG: PrsW family intramembrane metalloprotease [Candidatus Yanofskybacteria bacterium]|nr:PrsW family intramembrane metalloprotease [Candidatus Yanofskybacteria bacterium]
MSIIGAFSLTALGILPSLVWLSVFIKKDIHPEPRYLVTRTFLMGIIVAPIAVGLQWIFVGLGESFPSLSDVFSFQSPHFFLWAAFVEEIVKFLAVKFVVLNNPEFDEPIDAMIYMITASLGFAAIENILILFRSVPEGLEGALQLWMLRSVGATLLHALAGALTGYFLAISWFYREHQKKLIAIGIILASIFHFVFNIFLFSYQNDLWGIVLSLLLLVIFAGLIQTLFHKIRNRMLASTVSTSIVNIEY